MPKEPNTSKPVPKKPPTASKTSNETTDVKGKVVRKDMPSDNAAKTAAGGASETDSPKPSGKNVRKNTPAAGSTVPFGGETVGFEPPQKPVDAEAAAEDILLGDD